MATLRDKLLNSYNNAVNSAKNFGRGVYQSSPIKALGEVIGTGMYARQAQPYLDRAQRQALNTMNIARKYGVGGTNEAADILQNISSQYGKMGEQTYGKAAYGVGGTALTMMGARNIALQPIRQTAMNTALTAGIGGTLNKLGGGSFAEGAGRTVSMMPQINAVVGLTNPLIAKGIQKMPLMGNPFVQERAASSLANVAQGIGIDVSTGNKTTPFSVGLDALTGFAGGKGSFANTAVKGMAPIKTKVKEALLKQNDILDSVQRAKTGFAGDNGKIDLDGVTKVTKLHTYFFGENNTRKVSPSQMADNLLDLLRGAQVEDSMRQEGITLGIKAPDDPILERQAQNAMRKIEELRIKKLQQNIPNDTKGSLSGVKPLDRDIESTYGKLLAEGNKKRIAEFERKYIRTREPQATVQPRVPQNQQPSLINQGPGMTSVGQILKEQTQRTEVGKTLRSGSLEPTIPQGQKERGFVKNVRTSKTSAPQVASQVKGTYKPIANKTSLSGAQKYVDDVGWDEARRTVSEGPIDANTSSVAQELMRRAQNEGRYEDAVGIAEEIAIRATKAGQFNQAFSMWSRMTPEGMLRHLTKTFDTANKRMGAVTRFTKKILGKGDTKLDPATAQYVKKAMERANKAGTDEEKARIIKEMFEVVNKKLPWGVSDLIDEYRYNNMLSNPLTHLRNLASNLEQTYLLRPATLSAQGKLTDAAKYEIAALGALPQALTKAFQTFRQGKSIEKMDFDNLDITNYKPQRLPAILGAPSRLLQASDDFFSTLIQAGEKARGATDAEAFNTARYSLFQQDLKPEGQGYLLNKIDDLTRAVYGLRKVGLGWFIPFVKTPMNVAKQWVEYSPVGLATLPGTKNKREQVAKVMIGSIATLVGAKMAIEDRTTWAAPTDTKAKELFYASGKKPFSIRIGNKWVPMQSFGSLAYALALPAAVKQFQEDSRTALTDSQIEKLTQAAMGGLNFFSQQTFVSGLGSFVNLARGDDDYTLSKNIAYTAGQLVPLAGLQRYVANIIDPIFRKPSGVMEQFKSGIPFLTKSIKPYTDPEGNPSPRLPINNVMPYAIGVQNDKYEQSYQDRVQKLQQNNLKKVMKQANGSSVIDQASAAEPIPTDDKQIEVLYKDALSKAKNYQENIAKAQAGLTDKTLEEYRDEFGKAANIKKDIENQYPEKVFKIELDTYKSGGGMTTEERAKWAHTKLKTARNENELGIFIDSMYEQEVLTKSVVEALNQEYGLNLTTYIAGGKLKKLGGTGKKRKKTISDAQLLAAYKKALEAANPSKKNTQSASIISRIKPIKLKRQTVKRIY